MKINNVVILGAGVAGLAAANRLKKNNIESIVFEKNDSYGGLCRRIDIDGFIFDRFVHFSFTDDEEVRRLQQESAKKWICHQPIASNYYQGHWLAHPAQNNLYPLPEKEKTHIIDDFKNRPCFATFDNYQQWLDASFGYRFAELFSSAYTRKYWTTSPNNLETSWVGDRVLKSDLQEIIQGANTDKETTKFYTKEMRYPKHGGFQSFFDGLSVGLDIKYNKKIINIDTDKAILTFGDGSHYAYKHLISTLPLPSIVNKCNHVPIQVIDAANNLTATSGLTISIGINGCLNKDYLWFYVYDEGIPFARVYSPSLKSASNAPLGCSSLQAEIYFSKFQPLTKTVKELTDETIIHLVNMGVFDLNQLKFAQPHYHKFANVIFDHHYHEARKIVHDWLKQQKIYVAGRFGEWDYLWSGQSMRSGMNAVDSLISSDLK